MPKTITIEYSHKVDGGYIEFCAKTKDAQLKSRHPKLAVTQLGLADFKAKEFARLSALLVQHVFEG